MFVFIAEILKDGKTHNISFEADSWPSAQVIASKLNSAATVVGRRTGMSCDA